MRALPPNTFVRFWAKIVIGFFGVLLVTVWETVQSQHYRKDVSSLRREVDRLTYQNALMQTQINQWESPSHLDLMARQDLGMVPLDNKHIIGIEKP
jgi:hypothetical protein